MHFVKLLSNLKKSFITSRTCFTTLCNDNENTISMQFLVGNKPSTNGISEAFFILYGIQDTRSLKGIFLHYLPPNQGKPLVQIQNVETTQEL